MSQVTTFGCRLNSYESEVIKDALQEAGLIDNVMVFNTCAVTKEAERQARQSIRRYRKQYPSNKIIVTGCAAQINPESFASMPEVNQVIGNIEKLKKETFLDDTTKIIVTDIMAVKEIAGHLITNIEGMSRAFVEIQNGCNHRCTYCTIPYGRGNNRSVPVGEIVTQVKKLMDHNCHEVVFTGVDISDYGLDLPAQPTLAHLIKRLLKMVPNLKRLRLSSIDVAEIDHELFELLAHEPRVMPHIHISLQSGDNMILKRMKRRHNREQVIEFCHSLRQLRPDIAFGADLIAGFPTETEDMFCNSLKLIEEADLQLLHIFPYSSRAGTPAARMPQIDKKIRKRRAQILRQAGDVQLQKFLLGQVNKVTDILVEQPYIGRTDNFIQVSFNEQQLPGSIAKAHINACDNKQLLANII